MRSSAVADFYATKYRGKLQQWLTSALGPLIAGFKRIEDEQKQTEERLSIKGSSAAKGENRHFCRESFGLDFIM